MFASYENWVRCSIRSKPVFSTALVILSRPLFPNFCASLKLCNLCLDNVVGVFVGSRGSVPYGDEATPGLVRQDQCHHACARADVLASGPPGLVEGGMKVSPFQGQPESGIWSEMAQHSRHGQSPDGAAQ